MIKVSVYVDNVFAALPDTDEALQMKREITASMEEQYEAALAGGASEDAALGRAVSQFGSVEELREALGCEKEAAPSQRPTQEDRAFAVQWVGEYMAFKKKFAKMIALGIALCCLALGTTGVMGIWEGTTMEWAMAIPFFGLGGVGAAVLVYYGIQHANYTKMLKMFGLDEEGNWTQVPEQPTAKEKANQALASRVCSLIMSVMTLAFLILSFVFHKWAFSWVVFPIGGVLCSIVRNAMGAPDED